VELSTVVGDIKK